MSVKERLFREIERLPENILEEVFDFVTFIRRRRLSEARDWAWTDFALGTGAFDFWNDPEEVEYSLVDLKGSP